MVPETLVPFNHWWMGQRWFPTHWLLSIPDEWDRGSPRNIGSFQSLMNGTEVVPETDSFQSLMSGTEIILKCGFLSTMWHGW